MSRVVSMAQNEYVSNLRYWVAALLLVGITLVVTLLLVRSVDGQLTEQLSTVAAAAILLAAIFAANMARWLLNCNSSWVRWLLPAAVIFGLAAMLAHLGSPNTLAIVSIMALGAESLAAVWLGRPRWQNTPLPKNDDVRFSNRGSETSLGLPATRSGQELESSITDLDGAVEELPGTLDATEGGGLDGEEALVTQQLTRSRALDGTETISGRVRVDFQANEKQGSAHLAFTPPLSNIPEVFVDQSSGPAATVSPGSVYAHGTRVDVRLDGTPVEPSSVWVDVYVVAPNANEEST